MRYVFATELKSPVSSEPLNPGRYLWSMTNFFFFFLNFLFNNFHRMSKLSGHSITFWITPESAPSCSTP